MHKRWRFISRSPEYVIAVSSSGIGRTLYREDRVKKLIATLVLLAACHSAGPPATMSPQGRSGGLTGGADVTSALRDFMAAAKQQDLRAMGAVWGGPQGPARDTFSQDELYKRELVMFCYLKHDRYDIVADAPDPSGSREVAVNVTFRDVSRTANFEVVRGPSDRWYVHAVEMEKLQAICSRRT
jgi:hypothetical protein